MTTELEKLIADAGLSEEEATKVKEAFNIGNIGKVISEGVMRQATFTRKEAELEAKRKTLEENWEKANTEYVAALSERDATAAEKDELAKKLQDAEKKLTALPQIDPAKVVSPEMLTAEMQKMARGQTAYFGRTLKIMREHQQLFGSDFDPEEFVMEAIEKGKTPDVLWEEKYNVSAKRKEVGEAKAKESEAKIREDERNKVLAEQANPATRALKPSSDPFYVPQVAEGKNPWDDEAVPESESKLLQELHQVKGA